MQGWCERKMSCAAREVLLKSVVQALPAYSMSCFKLTKGLCKKVTTNMSKFWWAGSLDRKGMHWQSWDKMCIAKSQGGLGFRDLEIFNDALLAKQAWRLLDNPNSLCARVLKARYFPNEGFLTAGCPASASKTWKAIIQGRDMLKTGLIRRVGNGETNEVWHDQWIEGTGSMKPMGSLKLNSVQLVSDLLDPGTNQWDTDLVHSLFFS